MDKPLKQFSTWVGHRKVLLLVLLLAIALRIVTVYYFKQQGSRLEAQFTYQLVQVQLKETFESLNGNFNSAESAIRGYAIAGDKKFVQYYEPVTNSTSILRNQFKTLESSDKSLSGNPIIKQYESWLDNDLALLTRVKDLCDHGDLNKARELISEDEGVDASENMKAQCRAFLVANVEKAQKKFNVLSQSNNWMAYASFGTAVLLSLSIFFFLIFEIRRRKKLHDVIKTRENFFHVTINSIGEGLITTNDAGQIMFMNAAAESMTGWKIVDALNQPLEKVFDVKNEATGESFENVVSRVLRTGQSIEFENNTILQTKNNKQRIISNSGAPLFDGAGKISGSVLVFQDITYQKEEEMRIARATIHAQETERQQMGLELHDNINQILVGASLSLGLAKQSSPDKAPELIQRGHGYVADAIEEIRRLSHRLTPVSFNGVPLDEVFQSLINNLNIGNRFKVQFQHDDLEHADINEDISMNLYRILQEQLKNVVQYSKATQIDINLRKQNGNIKLIVADNGIGFDPDQTKHGIGLGNIKKRTELFKGKFMLKTAVGKGCSIEVIIPLLKC
ncbi:MAG TPA: PAS domain-containing protein [Ferruginibacter sp.]|nr:PAS domain-containing protein [Ferruginibacter sp.]